MWKKKQVSHNYLLNNTCASACESWDNDWEKLSGRVISAFGSTIKPFFARIAQIFLCRVLGGFAQALRSPAHAPSPFGDPAGQDAGSRPSVMIPRAQMHANYKSLIIWRGSRVLEGASPRKRVYDVEPYREFESQLLSQTAQSAQLGGRLCESSPWCSAQSICPAAPH
jgi:hypothetical protein